MPSVCHIQVQGEPGGASGSQSYSMTDGLERFLCASWQWRTAADHSGLVCRVCSTDTQTHIYALQDVHGHMSFHTSQFSIQKPSIYWEFIN